MRYAGMFVVHGQPGDQISVVPSEKEGPLSGKGDYLWFACCNRKTNIYFLTAQSGTV